MLKYPNRVTGVVVHNTPAFGEAIDGPLWATKLAYWKDGLSAHRDADNDPTQLYGVENLSRSRQPGPAVGRSKHHQEAGIGSLTH